jgi:hypothetical protein
MVEDAESGPGGHSNAVREVLLDVAEKRHAAARARVEALQREHPEADSEQLTRRLIRDCARDLAIGGAVTGGAAASPVAGPAATAAMFGTEGLAGVSRLGEMVMAIGIVNGHHGADAHERALWVAAALGVGEGAAMGMTGLAAKAGARGGARLAAKIPSAAAATAAGAGRTKRLAAKMGARRGPWGLAALLPYTIGAGVGAAGNAALAASVGRAARHYFEANPSRSGDTGPPPPPQAPDSPGDDEIWDAEVIEERIFDD